MFNMKNIIQGGIARNYSVVSVEELNNEYGMYLMDDEVISFGYKLVRDALIFTNKRIIFTDRQGATGIKTRIKSINFFSVVYVEMETAGFGIDDSEIIFTYIKSPYLKAHDIQYETIKLEFPKKYNIDHLYKFLQQLAYSNCCRINNL